MRRAGQVLSKDEILDGVWELRLRRRPEHRRGVHPAAAPQDRRAVRRRAIETVRGAGYRLVPRRDAAATVTRAVPRSPRWRRSSCAVVLAVTGVASARATPARGAHRATSTRSLAQRGRHRSRGSSPSTWPRRAPAIGDDDAVAQVVRDDGRDRARRTSQRPGAASDRSPVLPTATASARSIGLRTDEPSIRDAVPSQSTRVWRRSSLHVGRQPTTSTRASHALTVRSSSCVPLVVRTARRTDVVAGRPHAPAGRGDPRRGGRHRAARPAPPRARTRQATTRSPAWPRTMNAMLDRVEDAARRQQRFVADASHELRSPLTRMRDRARGRPRATRTTPTSLRDAPQRARRDRSGCSGWSTTCSSSPAATRTRRRRRSRARSTSTTSCCARLAAARPTAGSASTPHRCVRGRR